MMMILCCTTTVFLAKVSNTASLSLSQEEEHTCSATILKIALHACIKQTRCKRSRTTSSRDTKHLTSDPAFAATTEKMLAHAHASPRLQNEDVFPMPLDEMLSRDLLQMSVQERNAIYEEMHGVTNLCPEETPEFLSRSLSELDHELQEIPTNDKIAYQEAQGFKGTYVKDAEFRLKFLRTDLFDAKKAAIRMVKFLDLLKSHYGVTALRRPIQLSDLGK
jgi:hypothetical protein